MSESLPLAERLQRMRALENERLANLTKQQLSDLRSELNGILQRELNTIRSDIHSQFGALSREYQTTQKSLLWQLTRSRILYPALTAFSVLATIWLSGWGLSTWQEREIAQNWRTLREQRQTLATLEQKTWGLTLVAASNGHFIVLPKNATTNNNWTYPLADGKHPAILLEKEK